MTDNVLIKNVLLPTDFNPTISKSIPYAVSLCRWTGAQLYVLITYRLIENTSHMSDKKSIRSYLEEQAQKKMELIQQNCLGDNGIHCRFLLEVGFLFDRIQTNILNQNIDLLILDEEIEKIMDVSSEIQHSTLLHELSCPIMYIPANKIMI
ncbi:universal stress protein [Fulvivirga sedimenti]|uniref:UspA domain-containing protein n=1 Tax=Fulvivirga sedimenti TaxID=2879465 RepID=A0A9X1HLX9_9BACT|nr:hypothetical protein [Fulvivirga sedimenti]MCA6073253.1 hypothetical protein [Fulvivirga sedimenti]